MKRKTVLTYGTFDTFHFGHWNILKRASEYGCKLIVGISTDEFNSIKNKTSHHNFNQRRSIVESISFVDLVIAENNWDQKVKDVIENEVDILIMGEDWDGKFDYLKDFCDVIYLNRTPSISSTGIKKILD